MKLLLDENLPRSLVKLLEPSFPGTVHVSQVDLMEVPDEVLWKYAQDHALHIVSKDRDFADRSDVFGPPPKVIWIRVGNCTVHQLHHAMSGAIQEISEFLADEKAGLLVIPPGVTT